MTGADRPAAPWTLRYAPHLAVTSVGYVVFAYASVPSLVIDRFGLSFVSVGLLMSVVLLAFTGVQLPGGRIADRHSTARLLLVALVAHALVAAVLDLAPSFASLLVLRGLWGLAGGFIVTVGATHIARLYAGAAATRQQGAFGGMLTIGGALAFLLTPRITAVTGWYGVHAVGALVALPAIVALWPHRDTLAVAPPSTPSSRESSRIDPRPSSDEDRAHVPVSGTESEHEHGWASRRVPIHPVVVAAALCYVATLSAYITLSTFITAYFNDIGVLGPLNVAVLVMASVGRIGGGVAVGQWTFDDARVIAVATIAATIGFAALTLLSGPALIVLPLATMLAVSVPFGAIFNIAADAPTSQGTAIAVVVAFGNLAALVLPAVTGLVRDVTGGYDGAFVLLSGLNAVAVLGALWLVRYRPRTEPP